MEFRVKEYRLKAKLTQEELANKLGISRQHLNALENGKVQNISSKLLVKLSVILDCKIEDLIFTV